MKNDGNQPVIFIQAYHIPDAFEKTLQSLLIRGLEVPTSFDREGDPKSRDATVMVEIVHPFGEPRFHKCGWPGGPEDLEIYRLEVVAGVHDHWVERGGVGWNYTYHERLFKYEGGDGKPINQIEEMICQMAKASDFYRRRFQITTWIPGVDLFIKDPPCLQRLHFRWLYSKEEDCWILNLNTDWRSRDFLHAWFMNVVAITDIQRLVAQEVAKRRGIKTRLGRYVDKSDSLHIYGKDIEEAQRTMERIRKTTNHQEIYWSTADLEEYFEEARRKLAAQLESEKKGAGKGLILPEINVAEFSYPKEWGL